MIRLYIPFTLLLLGTALTGCRAFHPESPAAIIIPQLPTERREIIGASREQRPIESITLGHGDDVTLILATIHGNEAAGTPLVEKLIQFLRYRTDLLYGRRVVIVPVANPDGFVHNTRGNVKGIDLNRNFPASNRQNTAKFGYDGLTEPESLAIAKLLDSVCPRRIVSIHQPLNCIDYDGPADDLARHMAENTRLPVKKLGSRPGSLGSYAGVDLGIPIITFEMPRDASALDAETLWMQYGRALLASIVYPYNLGD